MNHLFVEWNKLKTKFKNKFIYLFLDYDGTLTPIVDTPEKAVLHREVKEILKKLTINSKCKIAIISGRSLKDIKNKIGLNNIFYVGNHGLEIEGGKIKFESRNSSEIKLIIRQIREDLSNRLSTFKGVFIEDKGLTLSFHYRLADKKGMTSIKKIFDEVTHLYLTQNKIKINPGKMVYDIKPLVTWNKGTAVLLLLEQQRTLIREEPVIPIYIGDDVMDEDAFEVLKDKGLTIFVGEPCKSKARNYLKDHTEVTKFLNQILEIQNGANA